MPDSHDNYQESALVGGCSGTSVVPCIIVMTVCLYVMVPSDLHVYIRNKDRERERMVVTFERFTDGECFVGRM